MDMNDRVTIRDFIARLLGEQDDRADFGDDESLIRSGRLDSLAVTKIVMYLESAYRVDFAVVEFDPERLDSVNAILAVIGESRISR
jgi:acyl carrier protein